MPKKKTARKARPQFNRHRLKLYAPEIKGFVTRWVNDDGISVQNRQEMGYEFVERKEIGSVGEKDVHNDNSDLGSRVSKIVNPNMRAYLMKIPLALYNEYQKDKQAEIDEMEQQLEHGNLNDAEFYGKANIAR